MEEKIEVFPNELPGLITVMISSKTKLNKSMWSMMTTFNVILSGRSPPKIVAVRLFIFDRSPSKFVAVHHNSQCESFLRQKLLHRPLP